MPDGTGQNPVIIRPLSRDDFPLLERWLAMPHVRAWWGTEPVAPADVERKYGPRADGTDPTRVFVIELAASAWSASASWTPMIHPTPAPAPSTS
jgi:hypothetical protein